MAPSVEIPRGLSIIPSQDQDDIAGFPSGAKTKKPVGVPAATALYPRISPGGELFHSGTLALA